MVWAIKLDNLGWITFQLFWLLRPYNQYVVCYPCHLLTIFALWCHPCDRTRESLDSISKFCKVSSPPPHFDLNKLHNCTLLSNNFQLEFPSSKFKALHQNVSSLRNTQIYSCQNLHYGWLQVNKFSYKLLLYFQESCLCWEQYDLPLTMLALLGKFFRQCGLYFINTSLCINMVGAQILWMKWGKSGTLTLSANIVFHFQQRRMEPAVHLY